jgi:hypothetical protein
MKGLLQLIGFHRSVPFPPMKHFLKSLLGVGLVLASPVGAQVIQFDQNAMLHSTDKGRGVNYRSERGVPLSSVANSPVGSDGRAPINSAPRQFSGFVSYGAVVRPPVAQRANLDTGLSYSENAVNLDLPRATNGTAVLFVHRAAQIGAPYFSRGGQRFLFGQVIPPPTTDEGGNVLPAIAVADYWNPEPYTTNNHAGAAYYWSPNAKAVFAAQAGQVKITWSKAQGSANQPAGVEGTDWALAGGVYFPLTNTFYFASGVPVKPTRKIYWTESTFRPTGKPVAIPSARVSAVQVVHNNVVPEKVDAEYIAPGQTLVSDQTNLLQELRTLWFDPQQGQIRAHNREGRVFAELLGDDQGDGSRQFLGFEVVDISQRPRPSDLQVELGERITPFSDRAVESELVAEPVTTAILDNFLLQHAVSGGERIAYYAVKETVNQNDVMVHWMERGEQGLHWPSVFARYAQVWPADVGKYSHYVRPVVESESEARATAVPLPTKNVPTIQYQDALDQARGKLTEQFAFYTHLTPEYPAHRTLLKFTSGEYLAFERVFSWLDDGLKTEALGTVFGSTVASNLTVVDYELRQAAYESRQTRGVNGEWRLYFTDDNGGADGQLSSWELIVGTRTEGSVLIQGQSFSNGEAVVAEVASVDATPSIITVSGVTAAVDSIKVRFNDYQADRPDDIDAILVGPRGEVRKVMSDAGGTSTDANVSFYLFEDSGTKTLRNGSPPSGAGTYHPFNTGSADVLATGVTGPIVTELDDLLLPMETAPTPVVADIFSSPRTVSATVSVGDRISPPGDENDIHQAGFILQSEGNSFHATAYADPFSAGFEAAAQGAIIPVNAIPGRNHLDIWWFRSSATNSIKNLINGFEPIYWPSVIGEYTIQWPLAPDEIVLASNDGSGALETSQAIGQIYRQPDSTLPGYNPNEEHALMLGGQAFALRDDLNIVSATIPAVLDGEGATYSSEPFVLLDHTGPDGRPSVRAFKVLREKPAAGMAFDYVVQAGGDLQRGGAGNLLQAPMPLPLLPAPVERIQLEMNGSTKSIRTNYNTEPFASSGDLPMGWTAEMTDGVYSNYARFTYRDRKEGFWVLRGVHDGPPALEAGFYFEPSGSFVTNLPTATAIAGQPFTNTVHSSRPIGSLLLSLDSGSLDLPPGLSINGLTITGTPTGPSPETEYKLVITDVGDNSSVTNTLTLSVAASGSVVQQAPLTIVSTNSYSGADVTYVGRPPFLAEAAAPSNSFTMRFYYKTQAGFDWPGREKEEVPEEGAVVPYLRPVGSSADPGSKHTASLDIVYRPVWPGNPPQLKFGETLMAPKNGLPAMLGQNSVEVLYQQSVAQGITNADDRVAVVLHDPIREKVFELKTDRLGGLDRIPDSVRKESYQGKVYFPNLPPHLAERFFFDPNRGAKGALILKGEYKDETVGEKYVFLNVLRNADLSSVRNLCPATDTEYRSAWIAAVDALETVVETYYENPDVPKQFIPNPELTRSVGTLDLVEVTDDDTAVASYALSASGPGLGYVTVIVGNGGAENLTPSGDPVTVYVLRVAPELHSGELKVINSENPLNELVTFQHTADLGGRFAQYEYEWKINPPVDGAPPAVDATMSNYQPLTSGLMIPRYTLGGNGVQGLVDNYLVMRYRPNNPSHPLFNQWSEWTTPQLAEGWIKRVLAGINPFNQRVTDLYNNTVNTDASILTSAGRRWEGDVALNLESINNYGLIEIYETVLRRGRGLSIDARINFGPANDALLLAAGYLNDLYMLVGNEAFADAANPTIGIGTKDNTYGDLATALFAFKGQMPSLLEEELALLRGRDDFLQPGVVTAPSYNRMYWNYTRGIDSGEVIYALNYNILDQNFDGAVDAEDAATLFPQGHGDAYGHYLTAVKGYYSLLMSPDFDWVPRTEAVTVLGKAVQVDYLDERKFAAAAAAAARSGKEIVDLTWRKDYLPGIDTGWEHLSTSRVNEARDVVNGSSTNNVVREWGLDQWANRSAQGSFFNWVIGNSILPEQDTVHEGIQKIDRTTVPELKELAMTGFDIQTALDNAEGRMNPLGLAPGSLAFDINPNQVVGPEPRTHFEQIFDRATATLNNAVVAFDDAKDVTRLMRSEQESLADFQYEVEREELAYTYKLIELYGTPYSDDIGPGKTWKQGYTGPDLINYGYVDFVELPFPSLWSYTGAGTNEFRIDIQDYPADWFNNPDLDNLNVVPDLFPGPTDDAGYSLEYTNGLYIPYRLEENIVTKPAEWTGRRASPGNIQEAHSRVIAARARLRQAIYDNNGGKESFDRNVLVFEAMVKDYNDQRKTEEALLTAEQVLASAQFANELYGKSLDISDEIQNLGNQVLKDALPKVLILGLSTGGDTTSAARSALTGAGAATLGISKSLRYAADYVVRSLEFSTETTKRLAEFKEFAPREFGLDVREAIVSLGDELGNLQDSLYTINLRLRDLDAAERAYRAVIAEGDRILAEREVFRNRSSVLVQGYRTRDAAFRIFRNEKLERYKTMFDLAARYAYLAATAYDYETGLLNTDAGKSFVNRIVNSRALGVVQNGQPQFAGSNTGDPGLSSALAEMKADWDVLKGRLGFNNPDAYGTTVSLRSENLRILPGVDGDETWQDVLHAGRTDNLLNDADVRRHCLQIDPGNGLPVPGIMLTFSTTVEQGKNLFGRQLAAGDSAFNRSSFATKIFAAGVALEGYLGMNDPTANSGVTGTSPADPSVTFLDSSALAATPYVYLIPVGVDVMRSPPLGDTSELRAWTVDDVAIPLPFNIGASDFSTKALFQSTDSLSESLFSIRKHQSFRPVSTTAAFAGDIYGVNGALQPSQFTNRRLIGRSAWNTRWKLVIPGDTLLSDPDEGLERFIRTVKDVKLHFVTYSYSGN